MVSKLRPLRRAREEDKLFKKTVCNYANSHSERILRLAEGCEPEDHLLAALSEKKRLGIGMPSLSLRMDQTRTKYVKGASYFVELSTALRNLYEESVVQLGT